MVRADYYFREARSAFVDRNYLLMYKNYLKAFDLNEKEKYYKEMFIKDAMNSMFRVDSSLYRKVVVNYAEKIVKDYQGSTFYHDLGRAEIYSLLGKFGDEKYFDNSLENYKSAVEKSKFLPKAYFGLAQVYIEKGECEKAIDIFEHVKSFLPKISSNKLNREHRAEVAKMLNFINSRIEYCRQKK